MNKTVRLLLIATLLAALAAGCAGDDGGQVSPVTVKTLGWVGVSCGRLVDEYGREWLPRGINARVEGLFDVTFDDGRTPLEAIPAFDEADAREMAHSGFNLLRLPINWSGLEPQEGAFSAAYLESLDRVIGLAIDAGIYVLVDFHQDAFSKEIGEDGAPLWAIIPEPEELLEGPLDDLQSRRTSPQVLKAFRSFFRNVDGIQDRFLPAWRLVVSRYAHLPGVIGFEPMNEPVSFYVFCGPRKLYGFYEKVADAMRELDGRHTLWLEPDTSRNQLMWSPRRANSFPDDNVVYEPHLYPYDMSFETTGAWKEALAPSFDRMAAEAASWEAALVLGEWGTHPLGSGAVAYIEAVLALGDERLFGHAFWLWKERSQGWWGLFDYDSGTDAWTKRSGPGMDTLLRPGAMAVPGALVEHHFDCSSNVLTLTFEAGGGEAPPLVFLPDSHYPGGADVEIDNEAVDVEIDPNTQRALVPWDGEAGSHTLIFRPKS